MARPVDHELVRRNVALIKLVRGRPLLEALHFLQHGRCAYDGEPCSLILPHVNEIAPKVEITKKDAWRFATLDHVVPKSLGGTNDFTNLVMASQTRNAAKGCMAPINQWVPLFQHAEEDVKQTVELIDARRWIEARQLAEQRDLSRRTIVKKLILRELRRLRNPPNFKFYEEAFSMVP